MTLAEFRDHVVQALAVAALVGGGATLIDAKVDNARQDSEIAAASKLLPKIEEDVRITRETVIRLEEKERERERHEPRN